VQAENIKPGTTAKKPAAKKRKKGGFLAQHSLSIASVAVLILWIALYAVSDPHTHWGSFFGNAIADWSGVVVTIFATKYLYELGSAESRKPPLNLHGPFWQSLTDHSLTLFLLLTGACWVVVYKHADPDSKWGQVAGNIVSEWTQILALVILTKHLIEKHSKESEK
jgi:membrane protease YdiL (CAAX protease family)